MSNKQPSELIQDWLNEGKNGAVLLRAKSDNPGKLLTALGITSDSTLGALLANSSGLLVDNGWIKVLGGAPDQRCPPIWDWNEISGFPSPVRFQENAMIVAYDMVGGFFAMNGGAFEGDLGTLFYFSPDALAWQNLDLGYTSFVNWCITGKVADFYGPQRWSSYQALISKARANEGVSFYPPLWTKEGKDIEASSKKLIPLAELWDYSHDMMKQLS